VEALSSTAYLYPKGKIMSTEATTGNDHIIELASKMAMNFFEAQARSSLLLSSRPQGEIL
jgi:hypothetical protein